MTVEEKNRYQNLIQAFALGALDKDDFIEIVHVLQTNEDFATQELGEYQNLTALLVSFINPKEVPLHSLDRILARIDEIGASATTRSSDRKTISFTKLTSFVDETDAPKDADAPESPEIAGSTDVPEVPEDVDPYSLIRSQQSRPVNNRQPGFQRPAPMTQISARGGDTPPRPGQQGVPDAFPDSSINGKFEEGIDDDSGLIPHIGRQGIPAVPEYYNEDDVQPGMPGTDLEMEINEPAPDEAPVHPISPLRARRKQLIEQEVNEEPDSFEENIEETTTEYDDDPIGSEKQKRKLNPVRGAVIDVSGSVTATAFWGVIGIMVICFSIVAYFLFSMFSGTEERLEAKLNELGATQAKTELLRNTVMMNQNLLLFISTVKTAGIVNFYGTEDYSEAFGKLFYAVKEKKGFLQFSNVMSFNSGKGFQLWIQKDGGYLKAGGINLPKQNVEFFELNDLPDLSQTGTFNILMTEENASGAETPSNNVILTGLLIMKAQAN
ncbi:MAG: hypothetical protein IPI12_15310 [Ignavibacteriales bacterium]|nr:hypothetical protein [Ignavibacteriales bacterium]